MEDEKWLPVPGFEGLYEVSDHGRVQKIAPWCDGVNHYAYRLLPVDRSREGHLRVNLHRDGGGRPMRKQIHRLVMHAFVRRPKPSEVVNHKDGVPTNNRLPNLEYCTVAQNTWHAFHVLKRGKGHGKGSKHPFAKLNDALVLGMLERLQRGEGLATIAKDFDVCVSTVTQIARNQTWPHLPREATPDRRDNYCQPGSVVQIPPNLRPRGSKLSHCGRPPG
jgi:hypothetical protein